MPKRRLIPTGSVFGRLTVNGFITQRKRRNGKKMCLAEVAEITGIGYTTLRYRLNQYGENHLLQRMRA